MSDREKKIIETAIDRFNRAADATQEFRREFRSDLEFAASDQWDPLARQQRTESSRPCFTVDRINPALRQIVNEERQNRPSIRVDPTTGGATRDVANVFAGMIRHIEQDSDADAAYDTAGWYAAAGGIGYLRVRSDYESELSFDQRLRIEAVADPLTVFFDYDSVRPDGSDAHWAFIVQDFDRDEFRIKYPESRMLADMERQGGWNLYNTNTPEWLGSDHIRVAEYFYRDYEKKTLYQFRDNLTGEILESTQRPPEALIQDETVSIIRTRPTHTSVIRWCILTSEEVLVESVFEADYIPVVPVYGEDYWVDGKRYTAGAIRRAKDPQKILNFTTSSQVETIDLNSKAPWIGAAGVFDTFETQWRDANRKPFGYLEFNSVDINGNPAAAPTRNAVEAPVQAIQQTKMQASEDIKAVFGIYDAALGAQGNETSGVAILARKAQSGTSNYHYYDNLVRSVKHLGRILVSAIPRYYDTPRMVRIVKPNGEQEIIAINQVRDQGRTIDLSQGQYDVVVQTGPSYATRRQEMVESGLALIGAYPQSAPLVADILADQMDFEGAKLMAKRLRSAVPPDVLASTNEDSDQDPEATVQSLQAQIREARQSLEALNAHSQAVEQELKINREEMILLKMKQSVDLKKAELDQMVKLKGFELDEQKTELEFLVKEQELILQQRHMALEEAKLALMGVQAASRQEDKIFDRNLAHIDRVARMQPGQGELNINFDSLDMAQPSEIMKPPSGLGNDRPLE
jgi:hypothetical protein